MRNNNTARKDKAIFTNLYRISGGKGRFVSDFPDMVKVMESETVNEFIWSRRNGNWQMKLL